jgi:excisionase family DNA binding protein
MQTDLRPSQSRWLRAKEAAEYLGWTRSALYKRVQSKSIPHYKVGGVLLFKTDELDRWLEEHRVEPRGGYDYSEPAARRRPPPGSKRGTSRGSEKGLRELLPKPKSRKRALPPPLSGTDEQKDRWALELEITRDELEEMSPLEFEKAWKARNERLEAAGVFEHLLELKEKYGQDVWSMPPSKLIRAAGELEADSAS